MIVRDEELTIERILKQVKKFADEIVVVDTGSQDKTKEFAYKYTSNIYDFVWQDDFSLARNFSFEKATMDYIMWLDADDYITSKNILRLNELKNNLNQFDMIYLPYETSFNESGKCTFRYLRERIVKNNPHFKWSGQVHEVLTPYGKSSIFDIAIQHKKIKTNESERNLKIYRSMIKSGKILQAREQFYYSNELYYNGYYEDAIYNYNKFLKCKNKFVENAIQALINLSKIYKIQKNIEMCKKSLFETFLYDTPRSEVLCELGHIYFEEQNFQTAIYYYKLAIQKPNTNSFAFVSLEMYDFIPYLQIALCYYYLKNYKMAVKFNKKALKINKKSQIAIGNQRFYEFALNLEQEKQSKKK